MPAIETNGLTKRFGGSVLAVDDLDLEVREGEIFGFLGPNGAGKSTTINMLLGFATPTAGEARVLGLDARERSRQIHERIGILPEGFGVYERLSAYEHLRHAIRVKEAPDDPDALLERVGLDADDAERPAGDYSKGMKQRLALGIALVGDPDLLILDEPSSGLDPTGMQEIRDIIRTEAADGTTVFFSSHILSEVEAVCDRVGIMNEGRLVTVDELEALRDDAGVATVEFELESPIEDPGLGDLDGVRDVAVEDRRVTVTVTDPSQKIRVIRAMDDAATVRDVISEETSLEELFNRYTNNGQTGSPADDDREPEEVVA
jgi:ABC-2 type transport system ATP-binding protein